MKLPHRRQFPHLAAGAAALLRQAGWTINDKRVERIWRREGLKVPHKQPKRGRLWLADGTTRMISMCRISATDLVVVPFLNQPSGEKCLRQQYAITRLSPARRRESRHGNCPRVSRAPIRSS
jgi:hypothetical protein